jgi:hypothetical protein
MPILQGSPSRPAHRTDQPLTPIGNGRLGAVPTSHLGGIGFDLMAARLAPDDQPPRPRRHYRASSGGRGGFHRGSGASGPTPMMSKDDISAVEWIIANTINETARGDPDALASRIVAALAAAGYGIVPVNGIEDTALGPQPFDKLTREMRPQDPFGDGRDWTFRTGELRSTGPQASKKTHHTMRLILAAISNAQEAEQVHLYLGSHMKEKRQAFLMIAYVSTSHYRSTPLLNQCPGKSLEYPIWKLRFGLCK